MIHLITGLPGHGKTLRAIWELMEARKKDEARPLYYRGIKGLKLDAAEIEGHDWTKCPDGSIIVIDEAQQVFPVRGNSQVPEHVAKLATHRHRGIDLILITQHPSLIDTFARKLIDRHTHTFRILGREACTIYQWEEIQDDPRAMSARELATSFIWSYPREVFQMYNSAVLHTAQPRFPRRLLYLALAVVAVGLCVWYVVHWARGMAQPATAPAAPASGQTAAPALASAPAGQPVIRDAADWLRRITPRIPYRPESAPLFDQRMETYRTPQLFCVEVWPAGAERWCRCYTEQATRVIGIEPSVCSTLAQQGIYRYLPQPEHDQRQIDPATVQDHRQVWTE